MCDPAESEGKSANRESDIPYHIQHELAVVFASDAHVESITVMVESSHTVLAFVAVLGFYINRDIA